MQEVLKNNILNQGQILTPGEFLVSENKLYILEYYSDGGLGIRDQELQTKLWEVTADEMKRQICPPFRMGILAKAQTASLELMD